MTDSTLMSLHRIPWRLSLTNPPVAMPCRASLCELPGRYDPRASSEHSTSQAREAIRTGTATCGTPHGGGQSARTRHRQARQTSGELRYPCAWETTLSRQCRLSQERMILTTPAPTLKVNQASTGISSAQIYHPRRVAVLWGGLRTLGIVGIPSS